MSGIGQIVSKPGWLRHRSYDLSLIMGSAFATVLTAVFLLAEPQFFALVLALDLWLLGYHHVIATFTRLSFDWESLQEHKFLLTWLPVLVLGSTAAVGLLFGTWMITTIYFYWQWWHITRQSYGISRVYLRKTEHSIDDKLPLGAIYLIPFWGLVHRCWEGHAEFLSEPIFFLPIPDIVHIFVACLAVACFVLWALREWSAWKVGKTTRGYVFFIVAHNLVFAFCYLVVPSVDIGWLALNVWHNAQYILFVWLYNTNRFKEGETANSPFLSKISQPQNIWMYFTTCLILSTTIYMSINGMIRLSTLEGYVPLMAIVYQTINFHHYIVDAIIWKVRKKPMQETLGLQRG